MLFSFGSLIFYSEDALLLEKQQCDNVFKKNWLYFGALGWETLVAEPVETGAPQEPRPPPRCLSSLSVSD